MRPIFSAFIPALSLLLASSISATPPQATFYVSPEGSPTAPGTPDAPCSLEGARELVRKVNGSMKGDILVNLRGGTYALKAPFTLREDAAVHDSGTGGFNVIYQACPGETPLLSGGVPLTGWTLFDKERNIYRAKAPAGAYSRQLYVNDRRAERARSAMKPSGWTKTATGWTVTDPALSKWGNPSDIEIVCRSSWKHLRCGIASISGTTVTMKTPGWLNSGTSPRLGHPWNGMGAQCITKVDWIENAFELLSAPGQWYMDRSTGFVYYIPLPSQDMSRAAVILPVTECLLDASGADFQHPLHHVQFKGITFAHATWLGPSGDQGYADNQTGVIWINTPATTFKPPGNLSFQYARDILFERNVICHMGGSGLDFGHAPQRDSILGNCIYDISCNGVALGEFNDANESDPSRQSEGNIVRNNYITQVGREYEDGVGICAGYNRRLVIDHNDVSDCPYTGIASGWGWDAKLGYSFQNTYSCNHVHHFMLTLHDGGAIYTLGNHGDATHQTVWKGNFVEDGPNGSGLYPDEGSGFVEITGNVVLKVGGHWLNAHSDHDLHAYNNYTDKPEPAIQPKKPTDANAQEKLDRSKANMEKNHVVIENNVFGVNPDALSAEAKAIVTEAGLESAFADIAAKVVKPDSNIAPPVAGAAAGKR